MGRGRSPDPPDRQVRWVRRYTKPAPRPVREGLLRIYLREDPTFLAEVAPGYVMEVDYWVEVGEEH